jgi:hypothetical protein
MPQEKLEAYQPNRAYKCGCICPTPAPVEIKENICPACIVKENTK